MFMVKVNFYHIETIMDISVPSRFACLKLVDDDYETDRKVEKKKEKPIPKKIEKPITKDVTKRVSSNKQVRRGIVLNKRRFLIFNFLLFRTIT